MSRSRSRTRCRPRGLPVVAAAPTLAAALATALATALLAVVAAPAPSARAQDGPPARYVDLVFERVERTNDVVFATATDLPSGREVELRLDLYEPAGDTAEARPVFVFAFGGGFVAGDRKLEPRAYCELMARRGYVAVAIDYRIRQGSIATEGIPAAVADARAAIRWLRANAAEHRLDPSRLVIGGSSAGAITALFTAYTDVAREPGDDIEHVAAVVDLWGGLYTQVNDMEAGEPPLAIVHGTEDAVVPFSEAEKLRARAEAVGIAYDWHPLEGAAHAPYQPDDTTRRVAPFLYEQLFGASSPATGTATLPPTATATDAPPTEPAPTATSTSAPTAAPPPTSTPGEEEGWVLYVPMAGKP